MSGAPGGFFGDAPAAGDDGSSTDSDSGSDDDSDLGGTAPNNGGTAGGGRGPRFDDDPVDGGGDSAPDPDPSPSGGTAGGGRGPRFDDDPVDGGGDPSPDPSPPSSGGTAGGGRGPRFDDDPVQTTIDAGGETADIPNVGVGSGPTPDDFGSITQESLRRQSDSFRENVAEPAGAAIRRSSPLSEADRALPGDPVGRSIQGLTAGAASIGNAPGIALGAIEAGERAARDTRRANEQGAEGRRQNRQELAADTVTAATSTGRAIQRDPVGTLSRIGGAAVGGAVVGGAASRALRGTPDAPDAPDTPEGTVPSGRSEVGTGGRGSILEDVDVDAERGISGPSARSRVDRIVSDSPLDDFLSDDRGQLQAGRQRSPDTGDTVDRTRPPDAGGTFEDVRDDALTQIQDDLGGRAERPNPGTFDDAPDPFRPGDGDTIDADGVQLQRTTGTPDTGGQTPGLDDLSPVNDPSRIATGLGIASGTGIRLDPANDPSGVAADSATDGRADGTGLGGLAGGDVRLGTISDSADPTGIAPTGDTDTGTGIDTGIGADTTGGLDTGTLGDTGSTGLGDGDTRTEPIPQLRADTFVGTQQAPGSINATETRTGALDDPDIATDIGADGFGTRTDFGTRGPSVPRTPGLEGENEDDDESPLFGLAADADEFDSGIASGEEQLEEAFGIETDSDPFSL